MRGAVLGRELVRLDDPDGYLRLARSLVAGDGLRINGRLTAYRPPLYPILLAPWVWACDGPGLPRALAAFHLGLGALTVGLVVDAARRWGLGRSACWVAATVAAADPVLVVQVRSLMTETLAACLLAGAAWGFTLRGGRGAAAGGLGLGLAALCRPSLLPVALLTAAAGLVGGPIPFKDRLTWALTVLVATLAVLCPWAIRNARVLGEPVWTTTHGGYTLALANNPAYYADVLDGPPGAVWSGPNQAAWFRWVDAATAGLPELESDRLLRRAAVDLARAEPARFARATAARLGRFWGLVPASAVYPGPLRWATAAWALPVFVLAAIGATRPVARRHGHRVAIAAVVALTIVHAAYWTDLRMRAPLVPALALLAGAGFRPSGRPRREAAK